MSTSIPLWLCLPFAGLLLSIAIVPLVAGEWWEKHRVHAVIFWSLLFIVPFTAMYGPLKASETVLETVFNDYLSFIVMLFGLFCVAGNITFEGDLAGSPLVNTLFLLIGTFLSSLIGTTGSSMLMLRPMIKINSWRRRKRHIMIFFIFLISNMGGCLTPLGDPPLLMGFMRGVPFLWSLHLLPILTFNLVILLTVFWQLDKHYYLKDVKLGYRPDISKPGTELSLRGAHNILFLLMIIIAVVLGGTLPGNPMFQTAEGTVRGIHIVGEVVLGFPTIIEIVLILAAAFLSFKTTPEEIRRTNHFTWGAIQEVAELFYRHLHHHAAGPHHPQGNGSEARHHRALPDVLVDRSALELPRQHADLPGLPDHGGHTRHDKRSHDNRRYDSGHLPEGHLLRRCLHGCKQLHRQRAELHGQIDFGRNGIHMPSFFGYIGWALAFLVPVFVIDTLVFFL